MEDNMTVYNYYENAAKMIYKYHMLGHDYRSILEGEAFFKKSYQDFLSL